MNYNYEYPRPAVAVDMIVLKPGKFSAKEILLVERKNEPFAGQWALPGGFLNECETLEQAAIRELGEETGIEVSDGQLRQLQAYSDPHRDPRTRVISMAFLVTVAADTLAVAADDAADAQWFGLRSLPELAFDHTRIIRESLSFDRE